MTAPDDDALERDIQLALEAGFNGARVHQKIAEETYLYHADRLGFLVWGEFADWGASGQGGEGDNQQPTSSYLTQWTEALERDLSHPSIVGWCPLNETYQLLHDRITVLDDVTLGMFRTTKLIDPTRPVIDSSGYAHRVPETDVWDSHDYEQDAELFAANQSGLALDVPHTNASPDGRPYSTPYRGQPYMVSEFGGIWWAGAMRETDGADRAQSWGYGQRVRDEEDFYARFAGLVGVLDQDPLMFGYCYTQLTDVLQEQNGVYAFDRSRKLDIARIRSAQSSVPAYEQARLDDATEQRVQRRPSARAAGHLTGD
jgi:beta-galactosidase/beta-glucuronidase